MIQGTNVQKVELHPYEDLDPVLFIIIFDQLLVCRHIKFMFKKTITIRAWLH